MSAPNLHTISDDRLVGRLHDLVCREREMLLDVLLYLNEVERRDLHLKNGYRSMFAYCTGQLKYSESAAGRRIQAARVVRRFPRVADLISHGDVNLSTISRVARIALSRNDATVFERIRGKTQDEAAAIAAEYCPRTRPRDRIRPVGVCGAARPAPAPSQVPLATATAGRSSSLPLPDRNSKKHSRSGIATAMVETTPRANAGPPLVTDPASATAHPATAEAPLPTATELHYIIQFVAGPDLMRAMEQVRALLSFRLPANSSMESVLAIVLDEFIERHSPDRRRERRKAKGAGRGRHPRNPGPAKAPRSRHGESGPTPRSRHIPAVVRDEVLVRDDSRCSYVGRDGTRCTASRHLQIDHIVPVARGGGSDAGNLRVLCGAHNRLEAERLLGAATMAPFTRQEEWSGHQRGGSPLPPRE